jgi:hypothetical protein
MLKKEKRGRSVNSARGKAHSNSLGFFLSFTYVGGSAMRESTWVRRRRPDSIV